MQILVALEHALHAARDVVVFLADNFRRERPGSRGERINRRVDSQLGNRPFQNKGRVQVRERGGRGRIGQVVGRYVHRLERSDRALLGRGNTLLERAHFSSKRRLVTDGARGAAEQGRHFRAGLRKPEDVVDEQQHILILLVAEIFRHGERRQGDAEARAGWFVHLAVHESDF